VDYQLGAYVCRRLLPIGGESRSGQNDEKKHPNSKLEGNRTLKRAKTIFHPVREQSFRFTHKNFTLHVFSAHVLLDVAASAEAPGGEYQKGIGDSQPTQSSDGQGTLYHHTTSLTT
jgi:hypothetical protein